jgi:hypothetical protein
MRGVLWKDLATELLRNAGRLALTHRMAALTYSRNFDFLSNVVRSVCRDIAEHSGEEALPLQGGHVSER